MWVWVLVVVVVVVVVVCFALLCFAIVQNEEEAGRLKSVFSPCPHLSKFMIGLKRAGRDHFNLLADPFFVFPSSLNNFPLCHLH